MPDLVTIREAAERLQVSATTVRRRLHRGEIPGVQSPTAHGAVWLVDLSGPGADVSARASAELTDPPPPWQEIDVLRLRVEVLSGQLEARTRQLAALGAHLEREQRRLDPMAREEASSARRSRWAWVRPTAVASDHGEQRRTWWRRRIALEGS